MKIVIACICFAAIWAAAETNAPPALPFNHDFVMGLLNHLAYWHLADDDYFEDDPDTVVDVLFKPYNYLHDTNDLSSLYIASVPDLKITVLLKKALYHIEEFNTLISNDSYKIVAFRHEQNQSSSNAPVGFVRIDVPEQDVRTMLFEKRNQSCNPSPELLAKIETALRTIITQELPTNTVMDETFFIAPLSDYSNNILVFWITAGKMLQFSSDADYSSDLYWEMLPFNTEIFDMEGDVVTSLQETLGSNAYVTKNWVGRILYNCIIDGYKLVIRNP